MLYLEKALELIDLQIAWVEKQLLSKKDAILCPAKFKWTGSIVEWVELIYSLYFVKRINAGKISLAELFRQMGEVFEFEVKGFAVYFMNIKNRSDKTRTKFIDLMKNILIERMIESDRKPARK